MNGQNEHKADNSRRTPVWLIEAAREVMGRIDLDPASDQDAQKTVGAKHYFCGENNTCEWSSTAVDGLVVPWFGHVWLNPPGGYMPDRSSKAAAWWGKLVCEYLASNVEQACFLAFSLNVFRTAQGFGNAPSPYEFPFLVFRERIRFPGSDGSKGESPNVDSALVYLPPVGAGSLEALEKFKAVFGRYGRVRI